MNDQRTRSMSINLEMTGLHWTTFTYFYFCSFFNQFKRRFTKKPKFTFIIILFGVQWHTLISYIVTHFDIVHRNVVVKTSSCSQCPAVKFRPASRLSWLKIAWYSSVSAETCWYNTLKIRHNRFLPHPLQFFISTPWSSKGLWQWLICNRNTILDKAQCSVTLTNKSSHITYAVSE
jgi:hypothetical protein